MALSQVSGSPRGNRVAVTLLKNIHRSDCITTPVHQSVAAAAAAARKMSSSTSPSFESLGIRNTNINAAPGVNLSSEQKVIVGSVLDLFSGNPTLKHFHLWNRDATFTDPLTIARGFDKYAAQWYGLPTVFNPIQILSHKVTSAKNPIEMELRNKYTIKGFGYDQTIDSTVLIHMGSDGKIDKVEDKWNGELPSGPVSEVRDLDGNAPPPPAYNQIPVDDNDSMIAEVGSMATEAGRAITTVGSKKKRENNNTSGPIWGVGNLVDLVIVLMFWPLAVFFLALSKAFRIGWFVFCHVAWWPVFVAFRKLNAVTVPTLVTVPKNEEEDAKMRAEREGK